jgi:hypothetical protein
MRKPTEIHVVMGSTGEYSDSRTWLVAAYDDKDMAEQHSDEAARLAKSHERRTGRYEHDEGLKEAMGDFDPEAKMDYTGTDYCVITVPFRSEVPDARS